MPKTKGDKVSSAGSIVQYENLVGQKLREIFKVILQRLLAEIGTNFERDSSFLKEFEQQKGIGDQQIFGEFAS